MTGYSDSTAFVRELTLKCTLVVAPKLQQKTINQQLLKHLSKLQIDEEQVCVCVCVCSHCRVSPPTSACPAPQLIEAVPCATCHRLWVLGRAPLELVASSYIPSEPVHCVCSSFFPC